MSTRINRIETVFPCPSFLLFVLCLLSRSSWNLCSNRSWSNYIIIIIIYYIAVYILRSTHDLHTLPGDIFFSHGTPVWPWPVILYILLSRYRAPSNQVSTVYLLEPTVVTSYTAGEGSVSMVLSVTRFGTIFASFSSVAGIARSLSVLCRIGR